MGRSCQKEAQGEVVGKAALEQLPLLPGSLSSEHRRPEECRPLGSALQVILGRDMRSIGRTLHSVDDVDERSTSLDAACHK